MGALAKDIRTLPSDALSISVELAKATVCTLEEADFGRLAAYVAALPKGTVLPALDLAGALLDAGGLRAADFGGLAAAVTTLAASYATPPAIWLPHLALDAALGCTVRQQVPATWYAPCTRGTKGGCSSHEGECGPTLGAPNSGGGTSADPRATEGVVGGNVAHVGEQETGIVGSAGGVQEVAGRTNRGRVEFAAGVHLRRYGGDSCEEAARDGERALLDAARGVGWVLGWHTSSAAALETVGALEKLLGSGGTVDAL